MFEGCFHEAEATRAYETAANCALLSPILLEIIAVSEHQLQQADAVALALQLKLASRPVHGEDIRPDLPELRTDSYVRSGRRIASRVCL